MTSFYLLFLAQAKEFYREKAILFWTFAFPVLLSGLLGIAFSSDKVPPVRIGVVTTPGNHHAVKSWFESKEGAERFRVRYGSREEMQSLIRRGKIVMWMEDATKPQPRFVFDPMNAEASGAHMVLERFLRGKPPVKEDPQVEILKVPGSRYIDFLIPGMIAFGVMNTCLWGIGWGLIERRMKKMLRRLVATPMNRPSYLFSLAATRLVVSVFEFGVLFGFAKYFFDVQVSGSWAAVLAVMIAGNLAFCGIGVIAGSRANSSVAGNGIVNALTLPMMMLSGVFFSYENFPEPVIPYIKMLPLTQLADSLRSVFVESAGLMEVLPQVTALSLTGLIAGAIGLKIFKWY